MCPRDGDAGPAPAGCRKHPKGTDSSTQTVPPHPPYPPSWLHLTSAGLLSLSSSTLPSPTLWVGFLAPHPPRPWLQAGPAPAPPQRLQDAARGVGPAGAAAPRLLPTARGRRWHAARVHCVPRAGVHQQALLETGVGAAGGEARGVRWMGRDSSWPEVIKRGAGAARGRLSALERRLGDCRGTRACASVQATSLCL